MAKFVRVRVENGSEVSMPETAALSAGYKPLDKPTHGRDLRLLPDKPRVPLGGAASAAKKSPTAKAKNAAADESQED